MKTPSWIKVGERVKIKDAGNQNCYRIGASGVIIKVNRDEVDYGRGFAPWVLIMFDKGKYQGAPNRTTWAANHLILEPDKQCKKAVI